MDEAREHRSRRLFSQGSSGRGRHDNFGAEQSALRPLDRQHREGLCDRRDRTVVIHQCHAAATPGMNNAKMAPARKLTVIMLRMLKGNVPFNPAANVTAAAS